MSRHVQTVEQTGKGLKAHLAISVIMVLIGTLGMFSNMGGTETPKLFIAMTFAGVVWFFITKIRTWWGHA